MKAKIKVAIQGKKGSFHHIVAQRYFGNQLSLVTCETFDTSVKEMLKVYNNTYINVKPQLLNFEEELDKSMAEILLIRLDNSYLFTHSIKFLKANKNYFDGESYFNDNIDWKVEFYKRMGLLPLGFKGGRCALSENTGCSAG